MQDYGMVTSKIHRAIMRRSRVKCCCLETKFAGSSGISRALERLVATFALRYPMPVALE
jgi:hypothetical protein